MFNNQNGGYSLADIAAATGGARDGYGFGGDGFGAGGWWIILLFLFAFGGWGNGFGFNGGNAGTTASVAYDFDISDLKSSIASNGTSAANGFYALNTGLLNGFADVTAAVTNGINNIRNDICNQELGSLQNTTSILQAINADTIANMQNTFGLTTQLNNMAATQAACCCDTKQLVAQEFAQLNYNLATEECATRQNSTDNTRAIIDNQNANTRSILDFLTQDRINALQSENAALKGQISQAEQNAFLVNALRPQPDPAYIVPNPYASYGNYGYGCGCGCSA
jgi:hypothetical protein